MLGGSTNRQSWDRASHAWSFSSREHKNAFIQAFHHRLGLAAAWIDPGLHLGGDTEQALWANLRPGFSQHLADGIDSFCSQQAGFHPLAIEPGLNDCSAFGRFSGV